MRIIIQNNKTGKNVKSGNGVRSPTQLAKDEIITSGGGVFGNDAPVDMNGNPLAGLDTASVLVNREVLRAIGEPIGLN